MLHWKKRLLKDKGLQAAFTLLELLVVLSLIFFVLTLSFSFNVGMQRWAMRSALNALHMNILWLQQRAQVTHALHMLTFNAATHTYRYHDTFVQLPPTVQFGFIPGSYGPPSAPLHAIARPVTFHDQCIVCSPDGILTPGTVYMIDNKASTMYALTIAVTDYSFIRKYHYHNDAWHMVT